jgi:protein-tyrosine phosphatase
LTTFFPFDDDGPMTTSTVLFLCSGNYYRSRFAEIYFNAEAVSRHLPWRAESRGFRLHAANIGPISTHAVEGLRLYGLVPDDPKRGPIVVTYDDLDRAARVIAVKRDEHRPMMERYFPDWVDRIEYWQIHDIDCAEPAAALSELKTRLDELLDALAAP